MQDNKRVVTVVLKRGYLEEHSIVQVLNIVSVDPKWNRLHVHRAWLTLCFHYCFQYIVFHSFSLFNIRPWQHWRATGVRAFQRVVGEVDLVPFHCAGATLSLDKGTWYLFGLQINLPVIKLLSSAFTYWINHLKWLFKMKRRTWNAFYAVVCGNPVKSFCTGPSLKFAHPLLRKQHLPWDNWM